MCPLAKHNDTAEVHTDAYLQSDFEGQVLFQPHPLEIKTVTYIY